MPFDGSGKAEIVPGLEKVLPSRAWFVDGGKLYDLDVHAEKLIDSEWSEAGSQIVSQIMSLIVSLIVSLRWSHLIVLSMNREDKHRSCQSYSVFVVSYIWTFSDPMCFHQTRSSQET